MKEETYRLAAAQDRVFFQEAVGPIWADESTVIMDASACFPAMQADWKRRETADIYGLVVHHKATWASYLASQNYVAAHKKRKQNRIAYHLGIHHDPIKGPDGRARVYLFNHLDRITWASGSRGKDSEYFQEYARRWGSHDANRHTIALNLQGFFASRHYPESILGEPMIWRPSRPQIRAVWSVYQYCRHRLFNFDGGAVFGHADTGKEACPGDLVMLFVKSLRAGNIQDAAAVNAWLDDHDIPDAGVPR